MVAIARVITSFLMHLRIVKIREMRKGRKTTKRIKYPLYIVNFVFLMGYKVS